MEKKRIIYLDILRTLVVVSAFVLHFNKNIYISFLSLPSAVIQHYIFTVGGFFFFVSGYMARRIYLDKYLQNPKLHSKVLLLKGLKIMSLYIFYVFFMRVFTNTEIPSSIVPFLFDHRFFTKVLFTFGLLYVLTPLFLFLVDNYRNQTIIAVIFMALLIVGYNDQWSIPYSCKMLLLDRQLGIYPLFSSIVVYAIGFMVSSVEINCNKEVSSFKMFFFALMIICFHLLLVKENQSYSVVVHERQYFTLIESITAYLAIIIARYITNIESVYKYLSTPYVLCVGVFSLHFYVISNLLLGLVDISKESEPVIKILGLIGIFSLSYMFTFWRFRSIYEMNSLTKRCS